jgi:capsular exopolysaccharide synthesis family protein
MGKVFDALQRAEAQRAQRRAAAPGVAPALGRASEPRVDRAGPAGEGRLSRLWRWLRVARRGEAVEDGNAMNKRRFALLQPNSFVAEQFRTLRARLDSLAAERPIRSLAVTSAVAGEGKTTAAVNLAVVASMSVGRRILLVDCDLRKPKVHAALGLRPEFGLAEVLAGEVPPERAIQRVDGSALEALPVRGLPSNPAELLASEPMRRLLSELSQRYDQIVLDLPPALGLPDAKTVSEFTDGLVFVVRADTTPQADVEAALDLLDRRRVLGLVLNGAETEPARYGY